MTRSLLTLLPTLLALYCSPGLAQDTTWLSALDLAKMHQGLGKARTDSSVSGHRLSVGGHEFAHGVGTHARSFIWIDLDRAGSRFLSSVGVDDNAGGPGSVTFRVFGDGKPLFVAGPLRSGEPPASVDLDLTGIKYLVLTATNAGDGMPYDHADWCDARIISRTLPRATDPPPDRTGILTPPPGSAPRINGPTAYGCRPGHPFLFRIPCTGERPIRFAAEGLPASLKLNTENGIITGAAPSHGSYVVTLKASNKDGTAIRSLRIESGERLALTPPMGWNHWYVHYNRITDALMREAADAMVSSGMADAGYQYVSIDDCWMNSPKNGDPLRVGPARDASGNIVPNRHFPDMNALTDHIHSKGLKAGIYTSPGTLTCAGFTGSYQHEEADARQFAAWGFDFLKYDWCSYNKVAGADVSRESFMQPYMLMGSVLQKQNRDIVLNLCQYGMGNVWEWGALVGGHCWRTAGDLGLELDRFFDVALKNAEHRAYSGPGSWNDPDYIQIGYIGDAWHGGLPAPCAMTENEQYAYMSLWSLMASPIFFSGDMSKLDPFTLNVLCNPEIIAIDQDPLGQSASVATLSDETFVMVKDLEDGSKAVGLFNRGEFPADMTATWSVVGVSGALRVRDLWRQKELGTFTDAFPCRVGRHGVVLVTIGPGK
jgi:alpha-galactosidase